MSKANFFQRRIARESLSEGISVDEATLDIIDEESDVEGALLVVEDDTAELETLETEAAYMDEDAEETEARFDAVSEVEDGEDVESAEDISETAIEQIEVGQESIRKRWGFDRPSIARESLTSPKKRRIVARESLWEDIKAFFRRIREWMEEQLAKLKDRWIAFHNAGKTIQAKSKKFDRAIRGLGQKNKDEIKGSWIEYLTAGGKVDLSIMTFGFAEGTTKAQSAAAESADVTTDDAKKIIAENKAKAQAEKDAKKNVASESAGDDKNPKISENPNVKKSIDLLEDAKKNAGSDRWLGMNYQIKTTTAGDEYEITFEKSEDVDVPSEIPTPTIAELNAANTKYNRFGIALEKHLKAWQRVGAERKKAIDNLKKFEDIIDKADIPETSTEIAQARKVITFCRTIMNVAERMEAHHLKCVSKGLNGYLTAGISAYKKAKK